TRPSREKVCATIALTIRSISAPGLFALSSDTFFCKSSNHALALSIVISAAVKRHGIGRPCRPCAQDKAQCHQKTGRKGPFDTVQHDQELRRNLFMISAALYQQVRGWFPGWDCHHQQNSECCYRLWLRPLS